MTHRRHATQRQNGHNADARRVTKQTKESRFDDDGEPVERETGTVLWDRYFETEPGTGQARRALNVLMKVSQ